VHDKFVNGKRGSGTLGQRREQSPSSSDCSSPTANNQHREQVDESSSRKSAQHCAIWSVLHGRSVASVAAYKRAHPPTATEMERVNKLKTLLELEAWDMISPATRKELRRLKKEVGRFL
jgi:hypothetical protein